MKSPSKFAGWYDDGKSEITLAQAKDWLAANIDDGCRCPCCGRYTKVYRRKLNKTMVRALVIMVRHGACTDYRHGPTTLRGSPVFGGDMGKLAYFGLAQECPIDRSDGGRSGWWKITDRGKAFMQGKIRVPKYALVHNDVVIGYEGEEIGIREVAPEFRLDDLMNDQ